MLKRLAIVLSLTAALLIAFEPRALVRSSVTSEAEIASSDATANNQEVQTEKKGRNKVVRVITSPFRAIGRLFGGGKKDDNKFHRLSEKDVKKFESSALTRVLDARTAPAAPTTIDGAAPEIASSVGEQSPTNVDQALAREWLKHGRNLLDSKDTSGAIASLTRAISLDPKLYDAHNLLGVAYETKGMRTMALESLKASLKGSRDEPEHINNYGYLLMKNGEYLPAIKYLKRAVKAKPGEQRFLNNLGLAQVLAGQFDDAYKSFERAGGEFEGRMNIATRLQRLGLFDEALKHLEKARALQPNRVEVLARLVQLYERTGRSDEAAETNKALISLRTSAEASQP